MDELPAAIERSLPLRDWVREGLRAGFFRRPRVGNAQPSPALVAALLAIFTVLELVLARLEVPGPAEFDLRGWLAPSWSTAVLLLLAWWALPPRDDTTDRPSGLAAWFALWTVALFPVNLVAQLLGIAHAHEALPAAMETLAWAGWLIYLLLWGWAVAALLRLSFHFGVPRARLAALGAGLVVLFGVSAWQFPDRAWQPDPSQVTKEGPLRLELSQETFEIQQALLQKAISGLAPERPGTVDVYGLVFSPYAHEDVFLRENNLVARLLAERFDAQDRVVQLANHAATAQTHPWATPANLERAIDAIGERMDRENDVLVIYMTSHGASDFKLAADNTPLSVDAVSPGELRQALDKAGIRHRVIAISACFSGGWVGPLASDSTLVMTAADATHTSFGCGKRSELTFFGRAVFDEQLRKTHSFEQAFNAAVPVIKQREVEAHKNDGFSNPQLSVGEKIRPVLRELGQRLDAATAK
ncbi:MAG: C13 family peptidase [Ramlibacter sp.]